jgi:hypothetical protein
MVTTIHAGRLNKFVRGSCAISAEAVGGAGARSRVSRPPGSTVG